MFDKKRKLVEKVFEKAKNELPKSSKTAIAFYLSALFEEEYGFSKDERTFVRFYKNLVEEKQDYNIDNITLDHMSLYIGYKDFKDFCAHYKNELITKDYGSLKVSISELNENDENLSRIVINITNNPVFTVPEFIIKNKNGIGIFVILFLGSIFMSPKKDFFGEKENILEVQQQDNYLFDQNKVFLYSHLLASFDERDNVDKQKKCMYWNIDHYEAIFCNKINEGYSVVKYNEYLLKSLKKINNPDTLTIKNSIGKVWYNKSNNKLELFTSYGIHPINGKTLKPISKYIFEKYRNNF